MIRLENLTKDFSRLRAVDNLNLHVKKGEIFGFLGPNGAGKTTTIRLMTGILQPTFGRVLIGGIDVSDKPRYAKQQIGYVPDHPYLYERLSGREFIEFQAQLFLLKPDVFRPRLEELSSLFSMDGWLDERIESYSQGMRQKVVMAAALIHQPELLVLDEPLIGLDPRSLTIFKDVLRRQSAAGTTVFFSTHALYIAQELCERMAIISKGRLVAEGTLDELRQREDLDLEAAFLRITQNSIQTEIGE